MQIEPIAFARNDFSDKFGIPRQAGLTEVETRIVFAPGYRDPEMLRGMEGFSHLWLIWGFSKNEGRWSPTVRPPRLGGNKRMGVLATRSPFRPNNLGLSSVEFMRVERDTILVRGADLLDGTPIYDIKPYLAYTDSHPEATGGFTHALGELRLTVSCPEALLARVPEEKREGLLSVLRNDPRPAYQNDPAREYGLRFGGLNLRFHVEEGTLYVTEID
ncbi:MAG: tRNA (N6-threonylcarbamoyladenosine(37)-N6)-methyltransferase TrmO [bacterium]